METSEVQAETVRHHGSRGDSLAASRGWQIQITDDRVLRDRGKMMNNMANGPVDCLVTEMLQCLPTETVLEVAYWFEKRISGECRDPGACEILRLGFSRNQTPRLRRDFVASVRSHF